MNGLPTRIIRKPGLQQPNGNGDDTIRTIRKPQLKQPDLTQTCEQKRATAMQACEALRENIGRGGLGGEAAYERCIQRADNNYARCISAETKPPPTGECTSDADCAEGYYCKDGVCVKKEISVCTKDADCPEGYICKNGRCMKAPTKGCTTDTDCPEGYYCKDGVCVKKEEDKDGKGKGGGGGDGGVGGEYKWSPEIQALLARILERANMLLDQPLGLSDEERQAIYNRIFEKIKGAERPAIQSQMDIASRQGLLGSPYAERAITGIQRGTRETLAGAERDIEIEEAQNRFNQLMQTTAMSQSLLGTGMSAEQIAEALSGARRGEGTGVLAMLLQYLATMGGQNSYYWQAIMNKLLQQGA